MRILAIDFGLKRVGLALSDADGHLALPYRTLIKESKAQLMTELQEIITAEGVEYCVVGLPLDLNGQDTLSTRQARNFAQRLRTKTGLPVHMENEALTSAEAAQRLQESGIKGRRHKDVLDQMAAVIILESFLSHFQNEDEKMPAGIDQRAKT